MRIAALACALLASTGCIRQRLIIRSQPPGADVLINNQRAGYTPYDAPFLWYGWYRLTLLKPGYDRLEDKVLLRSPWYFWIPLDLVAELLPVPIHDTRELNYELKPSAAAPNPQPPTELPTGSEADAGKKKHSEGRHGQDR